MKRQLAGYLPSTYQCQSQGEQQKQRDNVAVRYLSKLIGSLSLTEIYRSHKQTYYRIVLNKTVVDCSMTLNKMTKATMEKRAAYCPIGNVGLCSILWTLDFPLKCYRKDTQKDIYRSDFRCKISRESSILVTVQNNNDTVGHWFCIFSGSYVAYNILYIIITPTNFTCHYKKGLIFNVDSFDGGSTQVPVTYSAKIRSSSQNPVRTRHSCSAPETYLHYTFETSKKVKILQKSVQESRDNWVCP